jgi:small redox-active disulfide protein 2
MKLTIYGSGCAKCKLLAEHAAAAAEAQGIDCEIEKVTDVNAIVDAGVLRTPALAVDGQIVVEGSVPSVAQLREHLA